ncbi:MerR family transcriptional regulator [Clostridium botulinum]|uniref:MerR family transcriptional regulator n=2 Tax=Clostridium botulinum TaxID=1491 RepID=A0A846I2A1_CLOBO|nr:MerR family transcriptional regulator [Clostridium botulinum]AJD28663.1 merR regulatory family protein [Clostridium botulinum CDC_297]ACQ54176.1 transcriptional regulator, MerR family [Clostridium botulinum Ba4 str. 657]AJE11862.1 merR regulatory family protein [Clostridium botulinum CDC_1436]AXG91800.1 MerR family transcriptional regulator [Clostridium botulinum]EDT85854.1 transcriptional regulator, MerR family [Clostridium botulinum Bf]
MKDLFTIGEISKLFNINIRTLRYYDEIDLFKPIFIDKANSYRYYSTDQFEQLNTIKYLKALGMSLDTIDYHLKKRSIDNIIELFEKQKKITEKKIKELELTKQKIQNRINQINYARQYHNLDVVREIRLQKRRIVLLKEKIKSNNDLELSIRHLENKANKNASIFNGKVGVSISIDKLKNKKFGEYDSIFLFTEGETYNKNIIKVLPEGTYVSVRFTGTHKNSPIYYDKLLKYIEEKGYTIIDDSIEITLIDFGLTAEKSEFVTEIQILINKS